MKKTIDGLIKEFEKKSKHIKSDTRDVWENTPEDELYEVDIHVWRHKGMGNSLQTIAGTEIGILTAFYSLTGTLIDKNIIDKDIFEDYVEIMKGKFKE